MSIIESAKRELAAINFGDDDSNTMIEIMKRFFKQWDSGGAVSVAAPVLQHLIAGKPLSPLTGEDSEWFIHDCDGMYAQNMRCSSVFKASKDGAAYDIDVPGHPSITFPYWPGDNTNGDFRDGAQACREMLARFVEQGGDLSTAKSIRLNWNPEWGADPGRLDTAMRASRT